VKGRDRFGIFAQGSGNLRKYSNTTSSEHKENLKKHLTFWRPYIVIYSYNKGQQDALFLNFILIHNSICFGQTYCPSSGVFILYSQQLVFVYTIYVYCLLDKYQLLWIKYQESWWSTISFSETCRVVYQNKVEK